ncbi:MAG: hypothetical protein ABI220_03340 [Candidatus Saccharimonadales bacterium]
MAYISDAKDATLAASQCYVQGSMTERSFDKETVSQKFMLLLERAGDFAQTARKKANLVQVTDTSVESCKDAAADVFTILLDICDQLEIDLEQSFIVREQRIQTRT